MSTETLEQRMREFVAETDEQDWDDVLAHVGKRKAQLPRRRLVVASAACITIAALTAFLTGAFSSTHPYINGGLQPGPNFDPLELQFTHDGGELTSIGVTVNAATLGGTVLVQVVQGDVRSSEDATPSQIFFQERVPMTNVASPVSGPPGLELLSTWSGTLSPSDWRGGCGRGPYAITIQVYPAKPATPPPGGEAILSGSFSCSSWVPFT